MNAERSHKNMAGMRREAIEDITEKYKNNPKENYRLRKREKKR